MVRKIRKEHGVKRIRLINKYIKFLVDVILGPLFGLHLTYML